MRLLLDAMVGRLATYLRMCGHDAAYALDRDVEADDRLRTWAAAEDRRLVTRDRDLAARTEGAIALSGTEIEDQLRELRAAGVELELADPPVRCGRCNGPLERLPDQRDRAEYVPDDERPVWVCRACGQQFWRGSHWDRVRETLAGL